MKVTFKKQDPLFVIEDLTGVQLAKLLAAIRTIEDEDMDKLCMEIGTELDAWDFPKFMLTVDGRDLMDNALEYSLEPHKASNTSNKRKK